MEGPTPVSALIHAATMVTAGVYLIARCAPLWSGIGDAQRAGRHRSAALTALVGAILGMAQWDIKRILAYSTMSQIGYMIMGVGVGAYEARRRCTSSRTRFSKRSCSWARASSSTRSHNEQDVRSMGGLRKQMPFAFVAMLVGVLAICGIPGFSGFFSKDAVIYGTLEHGHPAALRGRHPDRGHHGLLHVPPALRHVLRRVPRERRSVGFGHPPSRTCRGMPPPTTRDHGEHAHAPAWLMKCSGRGPDRSSVLLPAGSRFGGETSPWAQLLRAGLSAAPSRDAAPPYSERS